MEARVAKLKTVKEKKAKLVLDRILALLPKAVFRRLLTAYPLAYGMETTNICNARCSFCGYRSMRRTKTVMDDSVFDKAVKFFSGVAIHNFSLTPTVGEPLVDKRIAERIKKLAESGIKGIFFYTNGTLLGRFDLRVLLKSGISRIAISTCFGGRAKYAKYYGIDKYLEVREGIIKLARCNRELNSPVEITLHLRLEDVDARNIEKLGEYIDISQYIKEENIYLLNKYFTWGGSVKENDLPMGSHLLEKRMMNTNKGCCAELFRRIHVFASGDVGCCVCSDLEASIIIGNVGEGNVIEVWRSRKLRKLRSDFEEGALPLPCHYCDGYVPVDEFIEDNRFSILLSYIRNSWCSLSRTR